MSDILFFVALAYVIVIVERDGRRHDRALGDRVPRPPGDGAPRRESPAISDGALVSL